MKKILIIVSCVILLMAIISLIIFPYSKDKIEESDGKGGVIRMKEVYLKVNNNTYELFLEDNDAVIELISKLETNDITVEANEYGGFEKVGSLGFNLPTSDRNIKTAPGDIVLYNGNQISIFYESNSWSYTPIGKISNITKEELKEVLGNKDVTITFTLNK